MTAPEVAAPAAGPVTPAPDPGAVSRPEAGPPSVSARESWQRLLNLVRERDRRLHAVLVEARVQRLGDGELAITFPGEFRWHFDRFCESRAAVEDLAGEVLGSQVKVTGTLGGEAAPDRPPKDEHRTFVNRAESMFNGRVVE